jgi:hypothetical protein
VRAADSLGNTDASPASYVWVIDLTAPDTAISAAPTALSNSTGPSFSFSSTEANSTFSCSLDGAAFAACASPKVYTGLGAGSHTFRVRATDPAGNTDGSPASFSWVIDLTAPNTTLTSTPPLSTSSSSASFSFTSTEANSTFACSLDGSAFAACTTPNSYTGLSGGSHTFQVRATDPAGNTDSTPASFTWTVTDSTPPETTITNSPSASTNRTGASFSFTSNEAGSTFQCKLDGGSFGGCTSPKSYTGVALGTHTFQVRAIDPASNIDPTPATYTWTVAELTACPASTTILDGSVRSDAQVCNNNNTYFQLNSDTSGTREADWYGNITDVPNNLTNLRVTYSGKNSISVTQTILIWNWSSSAWVTLDQRTVGTTEVLINDLNVTGTLANYVSGSSGTGSVRVRVRTTHGSTNFYTSADELHIEYTIP